MIEEFHCFALEITSTLCFSKKGIIYNHDLCLGMEQDPYYSLKLSDPTMIPRII